MGSRERGGYGFGGGEMREREGWGCGGGTSYDIV